MPRSLNISNQLCGTAHVFICIEVRARAGGRSGMLLSQRAIHLSPNEMLKCQVRVNAAQFANALSTEYRADAYCRVQLQNKYIMR